jgi:hypothetical protein
MQESNKMSELHGKVKFFDYAKLDIDLSQTNKIANQISECSMNADLLLLIAKHFSGIGRNFGRFWPTNVEYKNLLFRIKSC